MKTKGIIFNPARYEADQIRHNARKQVSLAVREGILIRPDHCPRCGEPEQRFRNGRTNIEGHYHDYSKPLDVEWMCRACHRNEQKEFNHSNPIPDPVDSPQLIALRDAVLSDDFARRPAKQYPARPTLDEYESQGDFYTPLSEGHMYGMPLKKQLGEWFDRGWTVVRRGRRKARKRVEFWSESL